MIDIPTCMKERRGKIVCIDPETMVDMFQPAKAGYIRIPTLSNVPKDAWVHRVSYDQEADAFHFLVLHPSFEKVPVGYGYPYALCEVRIIEIMTTKDRENRLDE